MFRVAVCQDSGTDGTAIAADLKKLAEDMLFEITVELFRNFRSLQKAMTEHSYQLLLISTFAGGASGLEFVRSLRDAGCDTEVVFLAEDAGLALDAYSVFPMGYLVEPITRKALKEPLRHIVRRYRREPRIILRGNEGNRVSVAIDSILYIEVFRTELDVHCRDEVHVCTGSLNEVCAKLPSVQFYRAHRSYIVNLASVSAIERYQFTMCNGDKVTVAKNRYAEAKSALRGFAEDEPEDPGTTQTDGI